MFGLIVVTIVFTSTICFCETGDVEYPFLDTTLPIEERVEDIVSRLTLEEKVSLTNEQAEAVPRLGIKKYKYWKAIKI